MNEPVPIIFACLDNVHPDLEGSVAANEVLHAMDGLPGPLRERLDAVPDRVEVGRLLNLLGQQGVELERPHFRSVAERAASVVSASGFEFAAVIAADGVRARLQAREAGAEADLLSLCVAAKSILDQAADGEHEDVLETFLEDLEGPRARELAARAAASPLLNASACSMRTITDCTGVGLWQLLVFFEALAPSLARKIEGVGPRPTEVIMFADILVDRGSVPNLHEEVRQAIGQIIPGQREDTEGLLAKLARVMVRDLVGLLDRNLHDMGATIPIMVSLDLRRLRIAARFDVETGTTTWVEGPAFEDEGGFRNALEPEDLGDGMWLVRVGALAAVSLGLEVRFFALTPEEEPVGPVHVPRAGFVLDPPGEDDGLHARLQLALREGEGVRVLNTLLEATRGAPETVEEAHRWLDSRIRGEHDPDDGPQVRHGDLVPTISTTDVDSVRFAGGVTIPDGAAARHLHDMAAACRADRAQGLLPHLTYGFFCVEQRSRRNKHGRGDLHVTSAFKGQVIAQDHLRPNAGVEDRKESPRTWNIQDLFVKEGFRVAEVRCATTGGAPTAGGFFVAVATNAINEARLGAAVADMEFIPWVSLRRISLLSVDLLTNRDAARGSGHANAKRGVLRDHDYVLGFIDTFRVVLGIIGHVGVGHELNNHDHSHIEATLSRWAKDMLPRDYTDAQRERLGSICAQMVENRITDPDPALWDTNTGDHEPLIPRAFLRGTREQTQFSEEGVLFFGAEIHGTKLALGDFLARVFVEQVMDAFPHEAMLSLSCDVARTLTEDPLAESAARPGLLVPLPWTVSTAVEPHVARMLATRLGTGRKLERLVPWTAWAGTTLTTWHQRSKISLSGGLGAVPDLGRLDHLGVQPSEAGAQRYKLYTPHDNECFKHLAQVARGTHVHWRSPQSVTDNLWFSEQACKLRGRVGAPAAAALAGLPEAKSHFLKTVADARTAISGDSEAAAKGLRAEVTLQHDHEQRGSFLLSLTASRILVAGHLGLQLGQTGGAFGFGHCLKIELDDLRASSNGYLDLLENRMSALVDNASRRPRAHQSVRVLEGNNNHNNIPHLRDGADNVYTFQGVYSYQEHDGRVVDLVREVDRAAVPRLVAALSLHATPWTGPNEDPVLGLLQPQADELRFSAADLGADDGQERVLTGIRYTVSARSVSPTSLISKPAAAAFVVTHNLLTYLASRGIDGGSPWYHLHGDSLELLVFATWHLIERPTESLERTQALCDELKLDANAGEHDCVRGIPRDHLDIASYTELVEWITTEDMRSSLIRHLQTDEGMEQFLRTHPARVDPHVHPSAVAKKGDELLVKASVAAASGVWSDIVGVAGGEQDALEDDTVFELAVATQAHQLGALYRRIEGATRDDIKAIVDAVLAGAAGAQDAREDLLRTLRGPYTTEDLGA